MTRHAFDAIDFGPIFSAMRNKMHVKPLLIYVAPYGQSAMRIGHFAREKRQLISMPEAAIYASDDEAI